MKQVDRILALCCRNETGLQDIASMLGWTKDRGPACGGCGFDFGRAYDACAGGLEAAATGMRLAHGLDRGACSGG